MTTNPPRALDPIGWKILEELQEDGRMTFTELGRRVGLSTPAAAERVRQLEAAGVIRGFAQDQGRIIRHWRRLAGMMCGAGGAGLLECPSGAMLR